VLDSEFSRGVLNLKYNSLVIITSGKSKVSNLPIQYKPNSLPPPTFLKDSLFSVYIRRQPNTLVFFL
jgi:hypothetical protein